MNNQTVEKSFNAFMPVLLVTLAVTIVFAWNLWIAVNQHTAGVRITAQQDVQTSQAAQLEQKLKAMMGDLVELAKTDMDAETIVKRYRISFNAEAAGAPQAPAIK